MGEPRSASQNLTAGPYYGRPLRLLTAVAAPAELESVYGEPLTSQLARFGVHPVPVWRDALERLLALVVLVVFLPVMLIVGILVWLDSPGPVLFRQWRVGEGGRLFRFTKFRTYFVDARERFPDLYAYKYDAEQIEQLVFKVPNDPRATRMGSWLRKSTLDELPNFWNVVTGDMAFIGPRPEIPEMLPYYRADELKKFAVRPGISGAAQINGRGLLGFRETVAIDVAYVDQRRLVLDIKILFSTVWKVFLRQGAF